MDLYQWIKHPELLNRETLYELRSLLARYPYFQTARLLYLKNLYLLHDIAFGEELRKAALHMPDCRVLFRLVEGEHYTAKALEKQVDYGPRPGVDRTISLIDAFLSGLPNESVSSDIVSLPIEAASDYSAYLSSQNATTDIPSVSDVKLNGQELIDQFLEKSEEQPLMSSVAYDSEENISEPQPEEMDEESYFTETLAKIYVKQQRYSKALEIIRRLNLKYPKKNAYFADQIRFLEKLIINAKSK